MQHHNRKKFRSEGKFMGEHAFMHNRNSQRHTQIIKAEIARHRKSSKSGVYYENGKNEQVDKDSSCKSAFWDTPEFGNRKRETKGWPKWGAAVFETSRQYPNSQNRKGGRNQSQGWTASEDRGSSKENDGRNPDLDRCGDLWMQNSAKSSLSKSACWDTTEVGKQKETSRCPKWGSAMSKTTRQCTSSQNRQGCSSQSQGCTASKDVDSQKKIVGMNLALNQSGNPWLQHIDKGSLIMSTDWDTPEAGNGKKETRGWPKWGTTMSVTSGQCPHSENRQGGWNKLHGWSSSDSDLQKEIGGMNQDLDKRGDLWTHHSNKGSLSKLEGWDKPEDCDGKREAGGWSKWDAALPVTNARCPSSQKRKGGWNKSQGWTTSQDVDSRKGDNGRNSDLDQSGDPEDGYLRREIGGRNPDLDQSGDPWMHNSNKGSLSKCAGWEKPEDCNAQREAGGWPKWDAALSATNRQCPSSQKRKGGWNQSQGWITSKDGDSRKEIVGRNADLNQSGDPWMQHRPMTSSISDWNKSASWIASYGDCVGRDCRTRGPGSDQTGGDSWKHLNPIVSSKVCWRKSGSWAVAEGRGAIREKSEWGASSDFSDRGAFKKHRRVLSPKFGGKRPYRSINRIPSPVWKHGHYRSNDRYIIGSVGVAEFYKYSLTGRSQRDSQFQQYSDRDLEEFRESKKARHLGHDRLQRFDDPWKQKDHLQDSLSLSKGSRGKSVENNEFCRNDRCCYKLLKRRCSKIIKSVVITPKCSADQDVHKSTHDWKNQQNSSICQPSHQKHDSPSEIQNDYTTNPSIQFKQNMQFNSQVPSSSDLNQSHQLISQHGSYPNEEVQNNENQAMSKGESFRRNDNFYDTSLIQDFNFSETKSLQYSKSWNACQSEPVFVQDNEEKNNVSEDEKGDGASGMGMVGLDDKGIWMFKCALVDFVKEIIKPIWKEGRLSKESHKTVVKKVIDKVVGVLGTSIPQTKERIDQYMSYSNDKLNKLVQDYLEIFINS